MKLLEAINRILPGLGESVVTSVSSKNPTVAIIKNAISTEAKDLQLQEWWFNTSDVSLYPGSTGEIILPVNTLSWVARGAPAVQRGNRLYNTATQSFIWEVGTPVRGQLKVELDFEDLPETAATVVVYYAAIKSYVDDIGVEDNIEVWQQKLYQAQSKLEAEHLRNKKYSTYKSGRYIRIRRAVGV